MSRNSEESETVTGGTAADKRKERLAAQLRANLRKRKKSKTSAKEPDADAS